MGDVSREGECRACEPMTDVEQRFDDARSIQTEKFNFVDCFAGFQQFEPW